MLVYLTFYLHRKIYSLVLRRFNQIAGLNLTVPNNSTLHIIKPSPTPKNILLPENYDKKIYHPITRSIIDLQIHFGVTKLEAIRLNPHGVYINHQLYIHRKIAHNKRDRVIPVTTVKQAHCLQERALITHESHLFQNDLTILINHLYTAECQHAGIDPKYPFRKIYTQNRLQALKQSMEESAALKIVSLICVSFVLEII